MGKHIRYRSATGKLGPGSAEERAALGVLAQGGNAELLTCAAANVEAVLRYYRAPEVLTALGSQFFFSTEPSGRYASFEHTAEESAVARWTGIELIEDRAEGFDRAMGKLTELLFDGRPVLVFVDAFGVPWNPYSGHEHHEHAFVIDGFDSEANELHVVDAYVNATPYGPASPFSSWIPVSRLRGQLRPAGDAYRMMRFDGGGSAEKLEPESVMEILNENVAAHRSAAERGESLARLARWAETEKLDEGAVQWLSLVSWLGTRARSLHLSWLREVDRRFPKLGLAFPLVQGFEGLVGNWQKTQGTAYMAFRRLAAGRPCPPTLHEALADLDTAEHTWREQLADHLAENER